MGPPMTQPRRSPITKRLAIQEPCSRLALISAPGCCSWGIRMAEKPIERPALRPGRLAMTPAKTWTHHIRGGYEILSKLGQVIIRKLGWFTKCSPSWLESPWPPWWLSWVFHWMTNCQCCVVDCQVRTSRAGPQSRRLPLSLFVLQAAEKAGKSLSMTAPGPWQRISEKLSMNCSKVKLCNNVLV